jgi:hypothetical protein
MAPFTVVKFSSEDCGTCHRMELKGGMAKGDFRERLLALVPQE